MMGETGENRAGANGKNIKPMGKDRAERQDDYERAWNQRRVFLGEAASRIISSSSWMSATFPPAPRFVRVPAPEAPRFPLPLTAALSGSAARPVLLLLLTPCSGSRGCEARRSSCWSDSSDSSGTATRLDLPSLSIEISRWGPFVVDGPAFFSMFALAIISSGISGSFSPLDSASAITLLLRWRPCLMLGWWKAPGMWYVGFCDGFVIWEKAPCCCRASPTAPCCSSRLMSATIPFPPCSGKMDMLTSIESWLIAPRGTSGRGSGYGTRPSRTAARSSPAPRSHGCSRQPRAVILVSGFTSNNRRMKSSTAKNA
jgi:hypothetical protein